MPNAQAPRPKRPAVLFYLPALILMLAISLFLFPINQGEQVIEVPYSTLMTMLDQKLVRAAEVKDSTITFMGKDEHGQEHIYTTSLMDDLMLVDRLHEAGVEFTRVKAAQNSFILSLLLNWILPFGLMILLSRLLLGSMSKRMGGGDAMSFGKSKAKVYVAAQTGRTFADVAGEDEAK